MSFLKEFREFAMRGNVVDMAVGVIIGGALEVSEDFQVLLEGTRDRFVMGSAMVVYYDWEKSLRDWLGKEGFRLYWEL